MSTPVAPSPAKAIRLRPMFYARQDYVGGFRHAVILAVDGLVLTLAYGPLAFLPPVWLLLAWLYLAVLKPSRFRSLGYWVADAKIVTLTGERPSPLRMTVRLFWAMLWLIGFPINFYLDLAWCWADEERQMLRDLYLQTRIVRNRAQPLGEGRLTQSVYTVLGLTLQYVQVRGPRQPVTHPTGSSPE